MLKLRTADAARSPELSYLFADLLAQVRKVLPRVETVILDGGEEAAPPSAALVLVLGTENAYFTATTLGRLRAALAEPSFGLAVPYPLHAFDFDEPIYTLRAYERRERRILAGGYAPREIGPSPMPVALFDGRWLRRLLERRSLRDLVAAGLGDPELSAKAVRAGICHTYIDYYGEVRDDILPFLPGGLGDVLEVGCGRGHTGALIQERLGCRVTGVELNPEIAAAAAARLHRVIVGDVTEVGLGGPYDAVVATELFEHLTVPERFLDRARGVLRAGGRIVLSVPNVGHHSVVEDLLAGRWDYLPIGLLCYTHFRFFTRATLASWLERLEFADVEIVPQKTELPDRFRSLPEPFETDLESLSTQGFYVIVKV